MHDPCSQETCPVCLDEYSVSCGALLPCGHLFCQECVSTLAGTRPILRCPNCRVTASVTSIAAVQDLLLCGVGEDQEAPCGQKMEKVIEVFRKVRAQEPSAKAVFFCQWAGLEGCLAQALQQYGIKYCQLSQCRDIFERTKMIEAFQRHDQERDRRETSRWFESGSDADVMLLSYEHSASGTHLTAANHVFILHPLVAETPVLSKAYEDQAIGRVARLGQTKDVMVHRFIASSTVEAALNERISVLRQDNGRDH